MQLNVHGRYVESVYRPRACYGISSSAMPCFSHTVIPGRTLRVARQNNRAVIARLDRAIQ
jgi:hypothetical protein